jgi:acyl carrier protein
MNTGLGGAGDDPSTVEILGEIVADVTGIDPGEVQPGKSFAADLGVDSLSMVEIVVAVEERTGVVIPDGDVKSLRTVADAVGLIDRSSGDPGQLTA